LERMISSYAIYNIIIIILFEDDFILVY